MIEIDKSCYTCGKRQFGFSCDTWDACDEVCVDDGFETPIFCTHGMTAKQITEKIKKKGKNCERWVTRARTT